MYVQLRHFSFCVNEPWQILRACSNVIGCLKGVATILKSQLKNVLVDYFSIDVVNHFAFDVAICFTLLLIMDLLWRPSHLIKQLLYQGCYFVSM
jgi:hypothetical protein